MKYGLNGLKQAERTKSNSPFPVFSFIRSFIGFSCVKVSIFAICILFYFFSAVSQEITNIVTKDLEIDPVLLTDSVPDNPPAIQKPAAPKIDPAQARKDSIQAVKDSIRDEKRKKFTFVDTTPFKDSLSIYYWKISENLGEFRKGDPDTTLTGFPNRRYVEGLGVSMSYLGNLGAPALSRVFSEREPLSNFMFSDSYGIYNRAPDNFNFINTRTPYSKLDYESEGGGATQNERLSGGISVNMNKKLNFGFDIDYLYARGHYMAQGVKHVDFIFYSSYFSDKYRYHFFYNNRNFINAENGGITDDRYITSPDAIEETQNMRTQDIPVRFQSPTSTDATTWNRMKGSRFFFTHRYNLGFERPTGKTDEDGEDINQFITIGSIIHTADLNVQNHKFISNNDVVLDSIYGKKYLDMSTCDTTRTWNFKNTLGLSLREGFAKWAKFDLTAFAAFDYRQYLLMERFPTGWVETQTSTYVGGEIAKTTGKILRYNAHAEFGVLGENLGDIDVSGNIETRIPVFKDTASLKAVGYMKNITPSFYEKHYHSKYFWWDNNDFNQTQRVYVGGELDIPHTRTKLSAGVENVTNYIFFNKNALPEQHGGSIQVINARWDQNFKLGVLHWNNQLLFQKSADNSVIPLPDLSIYSNLFLQIDPLKVLRLQLGADGHYFTQYYSPGYEPATQQFFIQNGVKIGNYPFINAYLNCKLHQVRFFVCFYNIGSSFISNGAYFSLPHYPVSPMVMKFGLSIDFKN